MNGASRQISDVNSCRRSDMTIDSDLPPMQLSMVIRAQYAEQMPAAQVPGGFTLRGSLPGDEESWLEVINAGEFGTVWDRASLDEFMMGPERREGSRIVTRGGRVVAATFASREPGTQDMGRVDFVVSHPDVRGLGLGRVVCTEVVRYLVGKGYASVILYTDDWRLPAIGLYLSMGFEPQMVRADMPQRWAAVQRQLGR